MILQALVKHYETLAQKGEIARPGWGNAKVSFGLNIDGDGRLLGILPLENPDESGKKMRPQLKNLPAPVKRTVGIMPNFLWDNAAYMLGIDGKGKPERAKQCFEAAKQLHLKVLDGADDAFARAVCAFFSTWNPDAAREQPCIIEHLTGLEAGGNAVFVYHLTFPDANEALTHAWQRFYDGESDDALPAMRDLVTGGIETPEAVHPAIKNVRGAQSSGAALVAFNAPAFCSYGREQNLNAPMGKYAAFAYTTALNHLLADANSRQFIGDASVVFWAEDADRAAPAMFTMAMGGGDAEDVVTQHSLRACLQKLAAGESVTWDDMPVEPENRFYVLGLSPNAARVSVRMFLREGFGDIARNMLAHYEGLEIVKPAFEKWDTLPPWVILRETVNPHAKDKNASPQMAGDMLRAILTGGRYPATIYQAIQQRIHADRNINYARAATIKAYLRRNTDIELCKGESMVQLNEETTYQPYVLGRLFAVLEGIQQTALPGLNTTIKDKYLTAACATPAVVFPTLLNLAEKHLRKMETGQKIYFSKQLVALTGLIAESFPAHQTLHDQGVFQLGYYHQTQQRYEKKNKDDQPADDAQPDTANNI